ncbi:hypothetical protein Bca101_093273 [Brassica carinata]
MSYGGGAGARERSRGDEDGYVGVVAADGGGRRGGRETLLAASGAGGRISRSGSGLSRSCGLPRGSNLTYRLFPRRFYLYN